MVVSNIFFYTPIWHFEKYFSDGLKPPTRNVVVNEFKGQPEKQQKHEQTLNFKFEPLEVVFIRSCFFWGGGLPFGQILLGLISNHDPFTPPTSILGDFRSYRCGLHFRSSEM